MSKSMITTVMLGLIIGSFLGFGLVYTINTIYVAGRPITIHGRVLLVEQNYNKVFGYYTTTIKFQSFSGDDRQYILLGRHDLDFGDVYYIRCVYTSPLGHGLRMFPEPITIEKLLEGNQ